MPTGRTGGIIDVNDASTDSRSSAPSVRLSQFSAVLVVNQIDPSIFNPDFLRLNQIVDPKAQVLESPVSTPQFSQTAFDDGVKVKVDPGTVIFEQVGNPLDKPQVRPPAMAMQFVTLFPNAIYKAVGINAICVPVLDDAVDDSAAIRNALVHNGQWLPFGGEIPTLGFWAAYDLAGKKLFFEIRENDASDQSTVVAFRLNVHRDLPETKQVGGNQQLLSVLAQWRSDLTDFEDLVTQYISKSAIR